MYNSIEELKKGLPEIQIIRLTDDEQLKPATIDAEDPDCALIIARAEECGTNADDETNSYCGVKYSVPFADPPAEVKRLSMELWIRNLHRRKAYNKEIEERADKAVAQLKDIAKGLKSLGIDPPPAAPTEGGAETNKTESDRIFTRDKMEGF